MVCVQSCELTTAQIVLKAHDLCKLEIERAQNRMLYESNGKYLIYPQTLGTLVHVHNIENYPVFGELESH